ncbi:hypothetical protein T02_13891 [Trichinella nativa]|uniref:Uncharacterized protein n=1 Tax=Trichinella nativa TaxID=6335 RepID=A0A0V1KWD4_9BILA|nr:hypothetical protein T02_13891 [Trichinella nativa]
MSQLQEYVPSKYQSNGILVELGAPKVLFHLVNIGKKQVRIRKAPLKPAQKLATVQDYLIPSLEYRLGVPGISRKLFESVDGAIWLTDYVLSLHNTLHGWRKPDFVLVKDGTAHIMDVAVPWEKGTIMHESPVAETKTERIRNFVFGLRVAKVVDIDPLGSMGLSKGSIKAKKSKGG